MFPAAVADAGGLLTAAGLLEGLRYDVRGYVALDAATLFIANFVATVHEGEPNAGTHDYTDACAIVHEWFPVRGLAFEAALITPDGEVPDSWAALLLAEALGVPLVTKHDDIRSKVIPVLHC